MNTYSIPGSSDGVNLATVTIAPENPVAVIQIVHGMAEHKERYFPLMNFLAGKGYACVICDLRGHGGSVSGPEDLGYMGKGGSKGLVDDVHEITLWAKKIFPDLPYFLFGHSMGSMIVRSYAKRYDSDIDGLFVCGSPSKNSAAGLGDFIAGVIGLFRGQRYRSAFLAGLCTGNNDKPFYREGIKNAWLSTNRDNVAAYNEDPLCGFTFTVNGYRNGLFRLMKDIYSPKGWAVANPDMPVLFIAGSDDPCIISTKKFSDAVSFMRKVGYHNVSSKLYPGMRHEILQETDRQTVWQDILDSMEIHRNTR